MLKLTGLKPLSSALSNEFKNVPKDDEPILDVELSAMEVSAALESIADTIIKKADAAAIYDPQWSTAEVQSSLMQTMLDVFATGTDLDVKEEQTSLEAYTPAAEGRLADFGSYLKKMIKKFIDAIIRFFTSTEGKETRMRESLDTAMDKASDGTPIPSEITGKGLLVTGDLKTYARTLKLVKDVNQYMLKDMVRVLNSLEILQVDLFKKMQGNFKFKDISPILDESAKLIYQIKAGLVSVMDGTADSGKAVINGRNTFQLRINDQLEYHFDLGDLEGFSKLTYTEDLLREAVQFSMTESKGDAIEFKMTSLSSAQMADWNKQLKEGLDLVNDTRKEYGALLNNFEGMFEFNRAAPPSLADRNQKAMVAKVTRYSEQLILVGMKLYSSLATRLNSTLITAIGEGTNIVIQSGNAHK